MKVLPIEPWGGAPPPSKPPVSRKPEGPWPRARVTPMPPPLRGAVNEAFSEEEGRKGCDCGREAELLRLHNVRLRQVASALASKLRASEAALGASRADADAKLAALVRALLAFEAGLRREQTRIRSAMETLEGVVRAQKAEIALLKAAASGMRREDSAKNTEIDLNTRRGMKPASILRDALKVEGRREGVKPPLPPRPAIPPKDPQASEVASRNASCFRVDEWMEEGLALNAHFEEFVLGEEQPSYAPPSSPHRVSSTPPPIPKPRSALVKPPRKHLPVNKNQATIESAPQFLLPDLLCPTTEGVKESSLDGTAYLKENAVNGAMAATPRGQHGVSKGRPLAPSALQNAITPKSSEVAVEVAKGHCSYERFLEATGLSQKSILSFHRPAPIPTDSTRPLPPPPPKHRSVLKPRDVKMRSKATRNVGWEDGFVGGEGLVGVVASESVVGATRRYWSGPYL